MEKLQFGEMRHEIIIPEGKEDYTIVMNIRNPYSRLVSLYNMYRFFIKKMDYEFSTWIKKEHYILMDLPYNVFLVKRIFSLKKQPSKYVRMESFVDDILSLEFIEKNMDILNETIEENILKNRCDKDYVPNGTEKKFWKDYYTCELAEMVQYKMKNEFEFFNYDINSWK